MSTTRFHQLHWRGLLVLGLVTLAMFDASRKARATDYIWLTTGSWFTSTNWSPNGIPTSADTAYIFGGTATVASPGATSFQTLLNGSMNVTGGGSLTNSYGVIGFTSGSNSTVNVGGGAGTSTWSNTTSLIVGNLGTGTLNINTGGLVITPDLAGGNATSSINFNGGTLRITGNDSASNTMNLLAAGGTIDVPTATNTFTMTGNISGAGSLTKTGEGTLMLTGNNTYAGDTNINGGILSIGSANALSNSSIVTFNGGTLAAAGTYSAGGNFKILAAGGTINVPVAENTLSLSGGITGSNFGGLIKNGVGTLSLIGTSNFNGDLNVDNGNLTIANGANVTCNSGIISRYHDGAAYKGAVTVGGSGGGATWNMTGALVVGDYSKGTLTVNSGSTVNSESLFISPDRNSANSSATVSGTVNTGYTSIGDGNAGTLTIMAGGVLNSNGGASIGYDNTPLPFTSTASGTVLVDGGTWNMPTTGGVYLDIGSRNPCSLTITNGGSVNVQSIIVYGNSGGQSATSTINIGGGTGTSTLNITRDFNLSVANCTINLNTGGVLNTNNLYTYDKVNAIYNIFARVGFNGGTLRINTTLETTTNFTIGAGGGIIDLPAAGTTFTLLQTADITGTAGGGLTKTGPGTLALDVGCNFNGPLTVAGGSVVFTADTRVHSIASETGSIAPNAGSTALVTVGTSNNPTFWNIGGALTVGGGGGTGTLNINARGIVSAAALNGTGDVILNDGGTLRITGTDISSNTIRLSFSSGTIDIPNAGSTFTLAGAIDGRGQFYKSGAGTFEVTGANTIASQTVVEAGKFLANNATGSATGFGNVIVNSGATLAGGNSAATKGFIAPNNGQAITINGTLAPGDGLSSIGVLTIGRTPTATAISIPGTYAFNIASTNAGSATAINNGSSSATRTSTTGNNLLAILGTNTTTVDFTGATIQLNASSVNLGGNWDNSKYFSWQLATLPEGVTPTLGTPTFITTDFSPLLNGGSFSLSFVDATNSIHVNFSPVPEPGLTLLAFAVGAVGWFSHCKTRRRFMQFASLVLAYFEHISAESFRFTHANTPTPRAVPAGD